MESSLTLKWNSIGVYTEGLPVSTFCSKAIQPSFIVKCFRDSFQSKVMVCIIVGTVYTVILFVCVVMIMSVVGF